MSKFLSDYKSWKILELFIGVLGISFIISEPSQFYEPNLYEMSIYHTPYMIPQIIVGIFLAYCFLLLINSARNKKIGLVVYYSFIIIPYILITILYITIVNSGI